MSLTQTQHKALEFIHVSIEEKGVSPTLREICDHMGYKAIGSAQDLIVALRKKGFLKELTQQCARSLIPTEKTRTYFGATIANIATMTQEYFDVPCLGTVPAGDPLAAIEDNHERLHVSHNLFSRPFPKADELFAVRANGQSMVNAGILDGDWLIVKSQKQAEIGSIVIARLEDDVTCKRFMSDKKSGWYLKPENPHFKNIYASESPFEVIGIVIALQRTI